MIPWTPGCEYFQLSFLEPIAFADILERFIVRLKLNSLAMC